MARVSDHVCDVCGVSIGGLDIPVVMYVVAGVVSREPDPLFALGSLPPHVEAMRDLPEPRVEYCLACWLERYLVHPAEVERLVALALQEQTDLRNERKVQEIRFKSARLLESAAARYRSALGSALAALPSTTES